MANCFHGLALAMLLCVASSADTWPRFRGPAADGVSPAKNIPVHWSSAEHVVWKAPIRGKGWSSPVLANGKLYLTTAVEEDNDEISLRAVCVNANDGAIIWDEEVFTPGSDSASQVHSKNSLASPTPIIAEGRLYVHFGHMGTAALDADGNILWRQTAIPYRAVHGNGGSPLLIGDLLAFNCDAGKDPFVVALDQASGEIRWNIRRDTPASKTFSFSTPIVIDVDGEHQMISAGSGFVGGYSPHDGNELWRVRYGEGYSVVPTPVFAHGLLFVASGYDRARLLAIDPKDAKGDVTESHVRWTHDKGVSLTPSVLVINDEIYFVSDAGVASCLDARTGKVHWNKRLGGNFSASPVGAEGRIYFVNEAGETYVVKASTTFEPLATNDLEERTLASPALADSAIYLRTAAHLWRIGNQ